MLCSQSLEKQKSDRIFPVTINLVTPLSLTKINYFHSTFLMLLLHEMAQIA